MRENPLFSSPRYNLSKRRSDKHNEKKTCSRFPAARLQGDATIYLPQLVATVAKVTHTVVYDIVLSLSEVSSVWACGGVREVWVTVR